MSTTFFNGSNSSSNGVNPSPQGGASQNDASGIGVFDATLARKERMKQLAAGEIAKSKRVKSTSLEDTSVGNSVAPAIPQVPVQQAPVAPAIPVAVVPQPIAPQVPQPVVAAASVTQSPALSREELQKFMVNFVVEQTGYPEEMVELDADLEADLGIDSIKKAQMFGEIAEHLNIQIQITEDMSLDDYPSLNHIVDFLLNSSGSPAPAASAPVTSNNQPVAVAPQAAMPQVPQPVAAAPSPVVATSSAGLSREELQKFMVNFVVEQTGYPEEMVELDADLEADLGIDSIKKAQMFGEIAEHLNIQIQITEDMSLDDYPSLNHIVDFLLNSSGATTSTPAATAPIQQNNSNSQPVAAAPQPVVTSVPQPVTATPAPTAGASLSREELQKFMVNFVVEQTGYPEEMVELDADLEADLGIDSIKKAQMFGEIAEHLGIQIQITEDMSLDDYPSLNHIVDFLLK